MPTFTLLYRIMSMHLNEKLLKELHHVLFITHEGISKQSNIAIATWYRIVKTPSRISVQQLIDLANGLQIPVNHFFSMDNKDIIDQQEDYIVYSGYKRCYYDIDAIRKVIGSGIFTSYRNNPIVGISAYRLKESLLAPHRLSVTRFLEFCSTFNYPPFDFIVDPNIRAESLQWESNDGMPLPEDILSMRKEMDRLRAQLFNTQYELDNLRRNQNTDNMTKNKISAPVTWFYGIHFEYPYKDMAEPVRAWFQMLVAKEHPHYAFFFAKNGNEFKSVRFYTDKGVAFFEAECESDLANYLFSEKIMAGRIQANTLEGDPDMVEFKADLVANLREDREDTAELVKFRKEMIQKFG